MKSQDKHFNCKRQLCNRHYTQLRLHGDFLDHELIINPARHIWGKEEEEKVEELYASGMKIDDIAEKIGLSYDSVQYICSKRQLGDKYMRKNNIHYTAKYQEYDWCFDRFVNKEMSHKEMADELGVTKRVVQKWCVEIHGINGNTFKELKKLSDIQRQIIIAGTLGDGHIDRREDQPMYIESHAEDEKDYLFWKYDYLKDLCHKPPKYYKNTLHGFGEKVIYECQPHYRINTRIINELKEIREMSRIDKIRILNKFQLSLLLLDDGSRDSLWSLCVAEWTYEEKIELLNKCQNEFMLRFTINKDERYITFDALSSTRIDQIILESIPNNLDIIHKKIIDNKKIRPFRNSYYVLTEKGKIGLATYSKLCHIPYDYLKNIVYNMDLPFNEIEEEVLLSLPEVSNYAV